MLPTEVHFISESFIIMSSTRVQRVVVLLFTAMIVLSTEQVHAKICKISCQRQPKTVNYGFDNAMEVLDVDVGMCVPVYAEDDEGCEIPSDLRNSCYRQCVPRSYELHTRSNRYGPFSVKTLKSCAATKHHCLKTCERKPSYLYVFPGSKYQTRIDVGKCVGSCNASSVQCTIDTADMGCYSIRNRSIAVEGPNGYATVETIEECGCGQTVCYRADYFESFSEQLITVENNVTSIKRVERVINIGKCIGNCEGVILPGFCAPSPDDCQFRFGIRQAACRVSDFTRHTFIDINGNTKTVTAIKECSCISG